jgi:hypothetical protein
MHLGVRVITCATTQPSHKLCLLGQAIDKGLKKFVNKQEELLGVQGISSEWKAKVLLFVQKRTRASFVVQTSSDSSLSVP